MRGDLVSSLCQVVLVTDLILHAIPYISKGRSWDNAFRRQIDKAFILDIFDPRNFPGRGAVCMLPDSSHSIFGLKGENR